MALYLKRGEARKELKKWTEAIADYETAKKCAVEQTHVKAIETDIEKLKKLSVSG